MNSKTIFNLNSLFGDITEKFRLAGEALRENPGSTLFIPSGVYIVGTELSRASRQDVMDGKYGKNPQPTMFNPHYQYSRGLDLTGCRDVSVYAYGATLMVDGFMEPVCIKDAENVTIKGLTIDHLKKPFCKCTVLDVPKDGEVILRFDDRTLPTENMSQPRSIFFDPRHDGLVPSGFDWNSCSKERLNDTDYRVFGPFGKQHIGVEVYLCNTYHSRPAILVSHSTDTVLEDVTVHSQPGMGIVGFKSRNITMNRIAVVPSPGFNVSTNTDATHFASCSGKVSVENSRFLGHGDDAINVHNYFYYIVERVGENKVKIRTETPDGTHSQEPDIPCAGHILRLVERKTMKHRGDYTVESIESVSDDGETCTAVLSSPIPDDGKELIFENLTDVAEMVFRGNAVGKHFARSVLCKTKGAVIENNYFEGSVGCAIHIAAEQYWGEGLATENITVRNNTISCCALWEKGAHGCTGVHVNIDCDDKSLTSIHRNISITGNSVRVAEKGCCAFYIGNTSGVVLRDNTVEGCDREAYIYHCDTVDTDIPYEKLTVEN